jgi:hypothetical protein
VLLADRPPRRIERGTALYVVLGCRRREFGRWKGVEAASATNAECDYMKIKLSLRRMYWFLSSAYQ